MLSPTYSIGQEITIQRSSGKIQKATIKSIKGDVITVTFPEHGGISEKPVSFDSVNPLNIKNYTHLLELRDKTNNEYKSLKEKEDIILKQRLELNNLFSKNELIFLKALDKAKDTITSLTTPDIKKFIDNNITKTEKKCNDVSFDNRSLMAEDTEQKKTPLCWAHASAALLEEQLCLTDHHQCHKKVARTEVVAKLNDPLNSILNPDGERPMMALSKYLEGDQLVCLDKYAKNPYDNNEEAFLKELDKLYEDIQIFKCGDRPHLLPQHIMLNYAKISKFLLKEREDWTVIRGEKPTDLLSSSIFFDLSFESKNKNDFIHKVLLYYCQGSHLKSMKRPGVNLQITEVKVNKQLDVMLGTHITNNTDQYFNLFENLKKSGHSGVISLCYTRLVNSFDLKGKTAGELSPDASCGSHAVVLNAIRWNKALGKCEVYIKNSHSKSSKLRSAFYPMDQIMPFTFRTTFFEKK